MSEVAAILNLATPRILVLLDEVGRGTATFDGLSIAWAVVEHLQAHTRARTLFATHYHELTELADLLPGVKNVHVSVEETPNEIVFLRRVEEGSADKSYGIEVARLAGLPPAVIARAREILRRHEQSEHQLSERLTPALPPANGAGAQQALFPNSANRPRSARRPPRRRSRPTPPHRRPQSPRPAEKANLMTVRSSSALHVHRAVITRSSATADDRGIYFSASSLRQPSLRSQGRCHPEPIPGVQQWGRGARDLQFVFQFNSRFAASSS